MHTILHAFKWLSFEISCIKLYLSHSFFFLLFNCRGYRYEYFAFCKRRGYQCYGSSYVENEYILNDYTIYYKIVSETFDAMVARFCNTINNLWCGLSKIFLFTWMYFFLKAAYRRSALKWDIKTYSPVSQGVRVAENKVVPAFSRASSIQMIWVWLCVLLQKTLSLPVSWKKT